MSTGRIVVTGLGMRSGAGDTVEQNWESILAGRTGIRTVRSVETSGLRSSLGGEVTSDVTDADERLDRCHALARGVLAEAMADARIDTAGFSPQRMALSIGTSMGGARSGEVFHRQWISNGIRRANGRLLKQYPLYSVADDLAATFGIRGSRSIQSNACAAGTVAIGYAMELLADNRADVVFAGGVDSLVLLSFAGFSCLGALDPEHCTPLSRSHGLNLGEGAGFLVLERLESAVARGARIHAEVVGYGISADAHHVTAPDPTGRGAVRAMAAALRTAGAELSDVGYVNGHGTGTPANDAMEKKVIQAFGPTLPPMSSTKSMIGHTLGAAGAVEAVVTVLALREQVLPPTRVEADYTPDGLDIVAGEGRPASLEYAVSNSFAFGGNNASVLFKRYRSEATETHAVVDERPVVITGIGAVVPGAKDAGEARSQLLSSDQQDIALDIDFDGLGRFAFAELTEEQQTNGVNPRQLRKMDDLSKRASAAVADLLRAHPLGRPEAASTAIILATGLGPLSTVEAFQREAIVSGVGNKRLFPNTVMNAAGGHVSILNGFQGPTATICSGATSGITALHFAQRLIERGEVDRAIVVSADEAPAALLAAYARIPGYLSTGQSSPFDGSGRLFGGGAVALLLEAEAVASPDTILGRVSGFGMVGDESGPGELRDGHDGWAESFRVALDDAGVVAEDIDVVVSAACGRNDIDDLERRALEKTGLDTRPITAPKGLVGDLSATSALLGIAQALWMGGAGRIPAAASRPERAPAGWVSPEDTSGPVRNVVVSSFEIGGSFQSVVVQTS